MLYWSMVVVIIVPVAIFAWSQTTVTPVGIDEETVKVMPFVKDESFCRECHGTSHPLETRSLTNACDACCFKCHTKKEMESHHQTGMEITFDVPETLQLGTGRRLTCITCHDLTINRFDTQSRKAQSLFSRVFKAKKIYKSYYLVMDNRKGQLCKHCH